MARHDADINLRVDLTEGDITTTANKMAQRIERIFGRSLASGKLSTSTKSLLATLDKGYNRINQLRAELDRLRNTQTNTDEWRAQYESVLNQLKAVNDQMVIYTERARAAKDLGPDLGVWSDFIGGVFNANHGLGRFLATLTRVGTTVAKGGIAVLRTILSKIGSAAKAAAKHLADMAKNLIKSVGAGIINRLKSLASAITGVGKSTRNSNNAFKVGFMTLLRYGLGIRSVYFLFRRLRKALGEGIGNLAQYSPAFNTVISNFISALTQLKNSFATAFAPIINVVAPILTTFINLVSEAVTRVGMLIAALTGQKTFIRAKGVQTDFAGSMDKTAGSTDKANKAAEKYKRTLAGFDDVEILKNPDSDSGSGGSGGGGGGGGGTGAGDMFETVAMPSAFEDLAEMIREAWANADFTELGQILAEKIANALDNIPWDTVKAYAGKFGKSFATFLNGLMFVDEEGNSHLAQSIGRTIGEAINTVFTFANEFVSNIDPKLFGNFFADLFNSAIDTIDWNLIADTLSKGINNIFSAVETFADKFNFANLGTSIKNAIVQTLNGLNWSTIHGAVVSMATGLANFVNSFFTPDLFGSLGTTIAKALNTAISGIKTFAVNWDAKQFGKAIGNGINNFFETFNFESAGVTFGTLITKVGTALTNAISEVKWEDVGADLTDFIISIPWSDVFGTAEQLTEAISGAAGEALAGIAKAIFEGIQGAVDDYFAEHQGETGEQIALGILKEIADYLWKTVNWPVTYIVQPFITKFCEAFGINSPATNPELLEAARNVGRGILNGIAEPFKDVADWVKEHILNPIKGAVDGIKFTVQVVLEKVGEWAGEAWEAVKSGAKTVKKTVQTILEKVGDWAGEAWSAFKSGTETVKKTVQAVFEKIGDWAGDAWNVIKTGKETIEKKVSTIVEKGGTWTEDAWTAIKSGGKTLSTTVKAGVGQSYSYLNNRGWTVIDSAGKTLSTTVKAGVGQLYSYANNRAWTAINSGGKTLNTTVKAGVQKGKWSNTAYDAATMKDKTIQRKINVSISASTALDKLRQIRDMLNKIDWGKVWGKRARGGVFENGSWHNIAQYASGGFPRHGTMFVAGEAGAEAVGHIGGRTEVLNQSQMAAVMYSAVLNGTANLTKSITGHMTVCTNAVISNIGSILAVLNFTSTQIYDITNLVEKLNDGLSDIVAGKVVPTRTSSDNADLMKALNTIIQNQNNVVTREELQDILADAFRRYMNIDFYLGDEQVARHANAGNFKLNRRYGTV